MAAVEYSYDVEQESVAYDLSRFDNRRRVREALDSEPTVSSHGERTDRGHAESRTAALRASASTDARPRGMRLSAFAVLSYLAVFALFLLIVMSYMRLNEINVTTSRRANELADLKNTAAILQMRYEQKQNIGDIKERAADLGLYSPSSGQINYIDMRKPDYAIIYTAEDEEGGFLAGIKRIAAAINGFFE